jgi:hypothetical protein
VLLSGFGGTGAAALGLVRGCEALAAGTTVGSNFVSPFGEGGMAMVGVTGVGTTDGRGDGNGIGKPEGAGSSFGSGVNGG